MRIAILFPRNQSFVLWSIVGVNVCGWKEFHLSAMIIIIFIFSISVIGFGSSIIFFSFFILILILFLMIRSIWFWNFFFSTVSRNSLSSAMIDSIWFNIFALMVYCWIILVFILFPNKIIALEQGGSLSKISKHRRERNLCSIIAFAPIFLFCFFFFWCEIKWPQKQSYSFATNCLLPHYHYHKLNCFVTNLLHLN